MNGGAGVLPAHRNRGIALALKRASHARASGVGISGVFTTNNETNAPMLAINRRLGFEPSSKRTAWRRG